MMDLSILGKLKDIGWLKSRTMWVSIGFDVIFVIMTALVTVLQMIPGELAASILLGLIAFQNQMMKVMRMVTNTGILPVTAYKKKQIQDAENAAEKAIIAAANGQVGELSVREKIDPTPIPGWEKTTFEVKDSRPPLLQFITVVDYFGKKINSAEITEVIRNNAAALIEIVNDVLREFTKSTGLVLAANPATGTLVSGVTEGGFRFKGEKQGAPLSAHKEGKGVDLYDPDGWIDDYLDDVLLETFGLYRESPEATRGWAHLTTRAPGSGKRTFTP